MKKRFLVSCIALSFMLAAVCFAWEVMVSSGQITTNTAVYNGACVITGVSLSNAPQATVLTMKLYDSGTTYTGATCKYECQARGDENTMNVVFDNPIGMDGGIYAVIDSGATGFVFYKRVGQ